jgi:DNA-binding NtrC family response regulator
MYKRPVPEITASAADQLMAFPWPGNARELENCMHRAFLMSVDDAIRPQHLSLDPIAPEHEQHANAGFRAGVSIRDMERSLIEKTLVHVQGNRTEAALLLGISIRTLRNKLHAYESGMSFAG